MKKFLVLYLFTIPFLLGAKAQYSGFHWSILKHKIQNKNDSAFLLDVESKMWKESETGDFRVYEGSMIGLGFKVACSKHLLALMFKDSLPTNRATSFAELDLAWNTSADSCYLLSYTPMLSRLFMPRGRFGPAIPDTAVCVRIPTTSYFPFLKEAEYKRLTTMAKNAFVDFFQCKEKNDTLYRTIRFTCDSNEYLPQAPYRIFLDRFVAGARTRKLKAFDDPDCRKPLSFNQTEAKVVQWDSTNRVEDPNNPGTYISAPIKWEGQPYSILVYEKWIPGVKQNATAANWFPLAFEAYRRQVVSYGVVLSNGNIFWCKVEEANPYFETVALKLDAYEQCFRAERFARMKIFTF